MVRFAKTVPMGLKKTFEHRFNPIGTMFAKRTFTSFKELGFFGEVIFDSRAFEEVKVSGAIVLPEHCEQVPYGCFFKATVNTIDVPPSVTYLGSECFKNSKIKNLIFRSKTPPKRYGYWEFLYAQIERIYVPDESIELYRATSWDVKLSFTPLSEYQE